jgi:hypothetical protein
MKMIAWDQLIGTTVAVSAIIVPVLAKISSDRRKQHRENQAKMDEILHERQYLRPHDHIESDQEPLLASGIIWRRRKNDQS